MSYDLLRAEIAARRDGLSPRLRQIADFALANPSDMALETVAAIARKAGGVPPSSLIRFANAFGYDGFSAMQRVFRSRLVERSEGGGAGGYAERIETLERSGEGATAGAVLDRFAAAGVEALERLRASLPPELVERAVDVLAGAEAVHVVAQRRAFPVASYLGYALGRLGARCHLLDGAGGMLMAQAALVGPRDALLAVSFAPYAVETLAAAQRADEAGAPVVAITDGPHSPLAALARVALEVRDAQVQEFRSLPATMCLATVLVVRLGQRFTSKEAARGQRARRPAAAASAGPSAQRGPVASR
jgi:DNA-binding MurR/RpiR family transcriptional regulator